METIAEGFTLDDVSRFLDGIGTDRADCMADTVDREVAKLRAANAELVAALREYQRLVSYLQRTTNPEEWATHGDWAKLQAGATAALARARSGGAA